MSDHLAFDARIDEYEREAEKLFEAVKAGDCDAEWRFKWEHPRFRGMLPEDVRAASLELPDARIVIARTYGFENWTDLEEFTKAVAIDGGAVVFANDLHRG